MWRSRNGGSGLAPGDTVGPYRLEDVLGEGGMGVVFRARRSGEAPVALKVLKPELSGDDIYRKRFHHEVRAAREVTHPHLVPVIEADEADGYYYMASAFVPGASLAEEIRSQGPLELHQLARVAAQVAAGLDALHARNLVHRDVKPSNIIINAEGDAMLTDFGLARGRGYTVLTQPGQVMGTIDYLAPELIRGAAASPASDIYALGCTLYESVAGSAPFAGMSVFAAASAHIDEPPPDIGAKRPDVPETLCWAIVRALEKEPTARPPTATAYAHLVAASTVGRRPST